MNRQCRVLASLRSSAASLPLPLVPQQQTFDLATSANGGEADASNRVRLGPLVTLIGHWWSL
jgi:hypothetical protein